MKCELCGKAEALLHIQEIANGKRTELHICSACAERRGIYRDLAALKFSLSSLKPESARETLAAPKEKKPATGTIACGVCGYLFERFQESRRLGCPNCYFAFSQIVLNYLAEFQAGTVHTGRRPLSGRVAETEDRMTRLTRELKKLVDREEYERAAVLRDKIANLGMKRGRGKSSGR
jgi:protein arginine kinase activator